MRLRTLRRPRRPRLTMAQRTRPFLSGDDDDGGAGAAASGSDSGSRVAGASLAAVEVLALGMATLASTLTIYFTASTSVYSSKDSSHAAAAPAPQRPDRTLDHESREPRSPRSSPLRHSQSWARSRARERPCTTPPGRASPRSRRSSPDSSSAGTWITSRGSLARRGRVRCAIVSLGRLGRRKVRSRMGSGATSTGSIGTWPRMPSTRSWRWGWRRSRRP
jgi:hypothetical protein